MYHIPINTILIETSRYLTLKISITKEKLFSTFQLNDLPFKNDFVTITLWDLSEQRKCDKKHGSSLLRFATAN